MTRPCNGALTGLLLLLLPAQALTYNKISDMDTGRISIMYRRVQCVPPKPMVIFVQNNGGPGSWLRLFVEVPPASSCHPAILRW